MFELIAGIITAVVGAVASIAVGVSTNEQNKRIQEQTNAQNLSLTQEAWKRDDTAVQRRKQDLIEAGLSPTLAAGSAAGNTNPISAQSFKKDNLMSGLADITGGIGNTLRNAKLDYLSKASDLETAAANRSFIGAQINRMENQNKLDNLRTTADIALKNAQIGDLTFNQGYKDRHLNYLKAVAKSQRELGIAQYMLQQDRFGMDLYNNQWYWNQGLANGAHDLFSRLGIGRLVDTASGLLNWKAAPRTINGVHSFDNLDF